MKKRPKILFLSNIPTPYVVGYLNELGKYCDVKAVFEKAADETRPNSWKKSIRDAENVRIEILKGIPISARLYGKHDCKMGFAPDDKALSPSVVRHISREYDLIISGNQFTPTGIIAILYMMLRRIPYAIQSEGGFPGTGRGLKEWFKYFLMNKAVLYFSTCKLVDQYFCQYGATPDRIRRYIFTSMYERDMLACGISAEAKEMYKRKVGADGKRMILTVGRSVPFKGFDILLKAFAGLMGERGECCLYLVGADYVPEYKRIMDAENLTNVKFVSNVGFEKLKEYYYAADIFVLPTRGDTWGLVINEAMAYGLPVITTDRCGAGDALIENGVNGIIVSVENVNALRKAMTQLFVDPELCQKMGERNQIKLKDYTLEKMGEIIYNHVKEYVGRRE